MRHRNDGCAVCLIGIVSQATRRRSRIYPGVATVSLWASAKGVTNTRIYGDRPAAVRSRAPATDTRESVNSGRTRAARAARCKRRVQDHPAVYETKVTFFVDLFQKTAALQQVGVPNVKALVYIAGFAPDKGESLVQLVTMNPGTQIGPATLDVRPYPLPDGGTGTDLYLKKSAFHDAFAADLPLEITDQMQAAQRPFSNEAFQSLSGEPAWKTIPSWYMVATQDHAIPPATERFMAQRAHASIVEVDASHVAMISQPEATTRLILEAARSVR